LLLLKGICMSANAPQVVTVTCPACQTRYQASAQSIIDVGQDPRLKTMLLQGRLNVGVCPNCGTAGMLSVPLAYHDPEKELFLVLIPQGLRMNEDERQRAIGRLGNAVMNSLPAEGRKGYLLRPRLFLSFDSMIEAILEADGITPEMLEAQQEKLQLIVSMSEVADDPLQLAALIGQNEDKIDYEFFALLSLQLQAAEQQGQEELADKLSRLRGVLLERTETGREVADQEQALEAALGGLDEQELTREDLLGRILATAPEHEDQVLNVLISLARPLIDYQFFQLLTEQIDRAEEQAATEGAESPDGGKAERLKAIRTKILEITQELDAQVRIETQARARLLSEMLQSQEPKNTIRAHIDEIDDVFMSVLAATIAQNEQEHPEVTERLLGIRNLIVEVLEESAPPELRFISRLLEADYPDETRKMLANNQAMVTPQVLGMMEALIGDLESRGEDEASEKLSGILAQAQLMV
jgi:hypothetical protein